MIITIEVQNDHEMQWLTPLLEVMKKNNAQVTIQKKPISPSDKRFSDFLDFLNNNKKPPVSKIFIPSRETRNER
jgi:hypothetical protein